MAAVARDVMTENVVTVTPSTPLRDVARMFSEDNISGAPVVDEQERLVGIVSRTDVITGMLAAGPESVPLEMRLMLGLDETTESEPEDGGDLPEPDAPVGPTVEDVMAGDPVTVSPETPLSEIAARMSKDRFHRVVVTMGPRVVGIITSLDLLARFPASEGATPRGAKRRKAASSERTAAPARKAAKKAAPKAAGRTAKKGGRRPARATARR
jgi:CBS domain-containing protein